MLVRHLQSILQTHYLKKKYKYQQTLTIYVLYASIVQLYRTQLLLQPVIIEIIALNFSSAEIYSQKEKKKNHGMTKH